MKIVFAGTPTFSAFHLDLLVKSENEVAAVLTQPDRESGRGKKINVSPVKALAQENQILVADSNGDAQWSDTWDCGEL